jgi:hypothetical protein
MAAKMPIKGFCGAAVKYLIITFFVLEIRTCLDAPLGYEEKHIQGSNVNPARVERGGFACLVNI